MTATTAASPEQLQLKQALQAFRQTSANTAPAQVLDLLRLVAARLDSRLTEVSAAIDELAVRSTDLDTRVANAAARGNILSMSKFVEQARKSLTKHPLQISCAAWCLHR